MGKRERVRRMKDEGLHEIKNKYRVHAVNKKRKGLVFTAKKKRRMLKACASLSAIFVLLLGVFAIGSALLSSVVPNIVPDDFVTVSYELPTDGSKPDSHSALENIGYMNYRFKNQKNWYAEVHGTTYTPVGPQSVNTIKQYSDSVLIMADVTSSSLVNAGRQFCYVGNEVMWRELPKNSSYKMDSYEDMLALTFNDELHAHMTIPAFKEKNGLPGTELSVYVINEETLDHADEVKRVDAADWADVENVEKPVYSQTFYLRPGDSENLGAAAHYANQMAFTGGLTGLPEFNYITVTYIFDSSWQVLRVQINESYKATMGITVTCTSEFTTNYEYGTARSKNSAYEEFFKDFVGVGIDDNVEKPLDGLGLITSSLLTKPVTFELDLEINGKKTNGVISLDASRLDIAKIMNGGSVDIGAALGCVGLKAKIGDIYIYLEDSTAYLAVGDLKAQLPIDKLLTLIGGNSEKNEKIEKIETAEETGSDEDKEKQAPLFDLSDPVVSENGTSAAVRAELNLTSLGIDLAVPLDFRFNLDESKNASLESLVLSAAYGGIDAKVSIRSTEKSVPELTGKESYIDLYPYANAVYELISGKKLAVGLNYANADMALSGDIGIDFTNGLIVSGTLNAKVRQAEKTVAFSVKDGVAYLNLDGIRLSVPLSDAAELVKGFLPAAMTEEKNPSGLAPTIDKALSAVFDHDLAALVSLGEEENMLSLGIKGTELLKVFGVEFGLGDVNLTIDRENGAIAVNAFGAEVTLSAADKVVADTEGYTDILPYAQSVIGILKDNAVAMHVTYENVNLGASRFAVEGDILVELSPFAVSGRITVTYGKLVKSVEIVYGDDGYIYLVVDALRIKANTKDAAALISALLPAGEKNETEKDLYATIEKVLSLNFGELLSVTETEDEEGNRFLNAAIDGSKLLNLFGVKFNLGNVTLSIGSDMISANALGVNVSLGKATEKVQTLTQEQKAAYVDLKPLLDALPELLNKKALSLSGSAVLTAGGADYALFINRGVINFADGIEAYLDASLVLSETTIGMKIAVDTTGLKIAIGNMGIELAYADFSSLGEAAASVYAQVQSTVNSIVGKELLPQVRTLDDLLNFLSSLLSGAEEDGKKEGGQPFDLDAVLAGITIENSKEPDGLLAVKAMDVTLDILKEEKGFAGVKVGYTSDGFAVSGMLSSSVYEGKMPQMPADIKYLGKNDFIELLDYLAAALNTVTSENISVGFEAELPAENGDGTKYTNTLTGSAEYVRGGAHAFNVYDSETEKSIVVSPELYLHVDLTYSDNSVDGSDLYLGLYIFNYKKNDADNTLDFFVTLSKYKSGETGYNPLKLYASADEIMSLLSVAISAFGIDNQILNEYLVSHWLQAQTVKDLEALGASLLSLFGFGGTQVASEGALPADTSFISSIDFGKPDEFGVSTFTIGWKNGRAGISKKTAEDGKSYLTGADLGVNGTNVSVTLDALTAIEKTDVVLDESYFKLEGVSRLLSLIATSVTHPTATVDEKGNAVYGSQLNDLIYMNGQIKLGISSSLLKDCVLTINVDSIAVVFEEDGVAVNVRFSYKATKVKVLGMADVTAIDGDAVVNLTGKNGMVYIERTKTTDADGIALSKPEVLHRAMPLTNFVGDLINQVGFLFNLGGTIKDLLASVSSGSGNSGSGSPLTLNDFGDITGLLSCVYTEKADGTREYLLKVDCGKITVDGITLGNLYIAVDTMKTESGEEVVRNLKIRADDQDKPLLKAAGIITLTLNEGTAFTLRNPRGIVDAALADIYKSTWSDVAAALREGMKHRLGELDASNWEGVKFIEGKLSVLSYVINTEDGVKVVGTQNIVVATKNDQSPDAQGTIYADFSVNSYPSLDLFDNVPGFTPVWTKIYTQNDPLPEDMQITAKYVANEYEITLVSEYEIDGFTKIGEVWEKTFTYVYGSALPEAANEIRKTVGYRDGDGNSVSASDILRDGMRLCVNWELVDYKIYYNVDGVEKETVAHYGDKLSDILPVPEKEGYTFSHWSLTAGGEAAESVAGEADYYAVFTPNTYRIVLKSEYELNGFTADGKGGFVKEVDYVYGSENELPIGEFSTVVNGESKTMFLEGFRESEDGGLLVTLAGISRNTTLTAVWSEVKHKVRYLVDGNVATSQNYEDGANLVLPALPEKFGYTAVWTLNGAAIPDGYTVRGDIDIAVEFTANTYTFTLVSKHQPKESGFAEQNGVWVRNYPYTYGEGNVTLDALREIDGFFFGGFYTRENGSGAEVTALTDTLVRNQNLTVYVNWQDSTVNARLFSNVAYKGARLMLGGEYDGYYYTDRSYNNVSGYALDTSYESEGYSLLGWWAEVGENSYVYTTDVREYYGRGTIALFAVWTQDIEIEITNVVKNGALYALAGNYTGGSIYKKDDSTGKRAYEYISVTSSAKAYFTIYGSNANQVDTLNDKKPISISTEGTFDTGNKTSAYALGWGGAKYGGLKLEVTFKIDGKDRTFTHTRILSLDTYTITFVTSGGEKTVENVRVDCPFIDGYTRRTYADELAEKNNFVPARKEGYTSAWPHTVINGTTTVQPVYVGVMCDVRFESAQKIDGWAEENGIYVYETSMHYDATVAFYFESTLLSSYTVGFGENVFTVPALEEIQKWGSKEITEYGSVWYGQYNADTVVYNSEVAFGYNGEERNTYSDFVTDGYQLIVPTAPAGYTFLGWYSCENGVWEEKTSLTPSTGEDKVLTTLYALWQKTALSVNSISGKRGGGWFGASDYTYSVEVNYTDAELVGAFASDAALTKTTAFHYDIESKVVVDNDSPYMSASNGKKLSNVTVNVTVTYAVNGTVLKVMTASKSGKYDTFGNM